MAWGVWDWNLSWRKGRFQWESELIQQLMEDLQGRSPILNKGDGWEWRSGKQKEYVVKEVYELGQCCCGMESYMAGVCLVRVLGYCLQLRIL